MRRNGYPDAIGDCTVAELTALKEQKGPVAAYARMVLALRENRGVRLTYDELVDIVYRDRAVEDAVMTAVFELIDARKVVAERD